VTMHWKQRLVAPTLTVYVGGFAVALAVKRRRTG